MKALSKVPIATTQQIGRLFPNENPYKTASLYLNKLASDGLVTFDWHKRAKVWELTRAGRKSVNATRMKYNHIDHSLAVGDIYFTLQPSHFMFEPIERYEHGGKKAAWAPDAVFVHGRKVYAAEVQLTPLSKKQWARKWSFYGQYFTGDHYKKASYQGWGRSGTIIPRFVAITTQKNAATGFEVKVNADGEVIERKLIVVPVDKITEKL